VSWLCDLVKSILPQCCYYICNYARSNHRSYLISRRQGDISYYICHYACLIPLNSVFHERESESSSQHVPLLTQQSWISDSLLSIEIEWFASRIDGWLLWRA
jgi:hypothetical protein